ncbi:MAG: DUF3574 domain-containing protein [Okeania sp. SIO2H7]|nr:DUF3574 domain-containing protein [Okeania sp. SIO2H7]
MKKIASKNSKGLLLVVVLGIVLLIGIPGGTLAQTFPGILTQSPTQELEKAGESTKQIMLKDELYFGLKKPRGRNIKRGEWSDFIDEFVAPRFPEGLTELDTKGQYMGIKEPGKILVLVHKESSEDEKSINEIIDYYKKQFQQESVLHVTYKVEAEF